MIIYFRIIMCAIIYRIVLEYTQLLKNYTQLRIIGTHRPHYIIQRFVNCASVFKVQNKKKMSTKSLYSRRSWYMCTRRINRANSDPRWDVLKRIRFQGNCRGLCWRIISGTGFQKKIIRTEISFQKLYTLFHRRIIIQFIVLLK